MLFYILSFSTDTYYLCLMVFPWLTISSDLYDSLNALRLADISLFQTLSFGFNDHFFLDFEKRLAASLNIFVKFKILLSESNVSRQPESALSFSCFLHSLYNSLYRLFSS